MDRMQTSLARHHDIVKEFGEDGSPLKHCFWKKVKIPRLKEHIDYISIELLGEEKYKALPQAVKDALYEKGKKQIRYRGYQLIG